MCSEIFNEMKALMRRNGQYESQCGNGDDQVTMRETGDGEYWPMKL